MSDVQAIEDATRAALVAEEREIDGWWLRCNPQLPNRRPNSATTPIEGVVGPEIIDRIVGWYVARRRPPVIRVLSVSDSALDRELDERGWTLESPTLVMTAALGDRAEPGDARVLEISGDVPRAFVSLRSRLGLDATAARLVHGRRGIAPLYVVAPAEGPEVATGRAVLVAGRAGIYDVVTVPEARRRGWGSQVVKALLSAAAERGAGAAFLQVEAANAAATGMYASLGFATAYTYHYRRCPG